MGVAWYRNDRCDTIQIIPFIAIPYATHPQRHPSQNPCLVCLSTAILGFVCFRVQIKFIAILRLYERIHSCGMFIVSYGHNRFHNVSRLKCCPGGRCPGRRSARWNQSRESYQNRCAPQFLLMLDRCNSGLALAIIFVICSQA